MFRLAVSGVIVSGVIVLSAIVSGRVRCVLLT